ncbi:hypothetical protein SAMD00023353_1300230 [Rosellinia necatrix]|uniref:Uncharacterized protein n=1 Tax=Rosellinia necatrix TaxID=77044 RepID=A0A1W2TCK4_ROSNE|nr:hypothetical protein SAMD00023353_1300230 [Rosellinia necatrix]
MVAVGNDASKSDTAPRPEPGTGCAVTKLKRRFTPQFIEQTSRSCANRKYQHDDSPSNTNSDSDTGTDDSRSVFNVTLATPATRDAHINHSDSTSASRPTKTVRRFAPVPIETTFDSYRVANRNPHGPAPEPTPDPSPTASQSSLTFPTPVVPMASEMAQTLDEEKRPRRRFAPQLIETTRRAWRAGQAGPATQPTDKTDITPGTNHIYAPKPKRKHGAPGPSKGSSGLTHPIADDASSPALAPRRQRPLTAHSDTRRGTRTKSYHPELDTILSSESGNSSEEEDGIAAPGLNLGVPALSDTHSDRGDNWSTRSYDLRTRRESCDEEFSGYLLGIAAREAHRQREFEQALSAFPNGIPPQGVEHFFARDHSGDDLQIGDGEPPLRHGPSQLLRRKSTDPGWAVKEMRAHAEKLARMRAETHSSLDDNSDQSGGLPPSVDLLWTATARRDSRDSAMGSSMGPVPSTHTHSPALFAGSPPEHDKPLTSPPATGLRAGPFEMPFATNAGKPEGGSEPEKLRKAASPPMLGTDLSFRTCPSPKYTRMEPNQPYCQFDRLENNQRDASGATGLWRGYCSTKTNRPEPPALQSLDLLCTPAVSCSPMDPFASAFGGSMSGTGTQSPVWYPGHEPTDLHKQTLYEIDGRLEREMSRKEREAAIMAEFDDAFITQVYNYLSLGYAATARDFDDELSKISGICVEELRKDDNVEVGKGFMLEMEISPSRNRTDSSSSSSSTGSSGDERTASLHASRGGRRSRHKPPRWRALKLYIQEWARQHPSLNGDDDSVPPAWGVRARRGSWAI